MCCIGLFEFIGYQSYKGPVLQSVRLINIFGLELFNY